MLIPSKRLALLATLAPNAKSFLSNPATVRGDKDKWWGSKESAVREMLVFISHLD